ncbi:unnamed protein product [Caenorhabditis auriculariae]|uniref:G-protein coupled receptors family 1 profile domain-containing protein n=1 Tax=Caenorhabditis auriculariae TaxID=2777116 RepID=A0A8S1H886_9PELO|nr:unnamed protein product [Caenorhabditis auriculariae]
MDNCSTVQTYAPESVDLFSVRAVFSCLYCLVWIAGVVGNTLVLYVLTFNQVSLSVRTVFVGCLAASDLLMCFFSLPVTAVSIFARIWIFPPIFCKLIGVFQGGSIFVSSFTLTVIALDRCILILKPNREVVNFQRATSAVVAIWVLGYSLALPVGIYSGIVSYDGICGSFCEEQWPDYSEELGKSDIRRFYGLSVLLLQFGIPAVISSICYYMISRVMSNQLERRRGHKLRPESEEKLVSRKTRANRMMIVMVLGFIVAWMPLNAINLYRDLTNFTQTQWYSTVFGLAHVCAMCSAVLNPIIYSWFNPQFRTSITALFSRTLSTNKNKMVAYPSNFTEIAPLTQEKTRPFQTGTNSTLVLNQNSPSPAQNPSSDTLDDYQAGDQLL